MEKEGSSTEKMVILLKNDDSSAEKWWFCVTDVSDGAAEIANSSAYPLIRVVKQATVARSPPLGPTEHAQTEGGWFRPGPCNMGPFSAVCWMFGRRLQAHLGVPVGLIQNQVGGTAVERWSSSSALEQCDQSRGSRMAPCKAGSVEDEEVFAEQLGLESELESLGSITGDNSSLFNGMIAPWVKTAVRGAIWYQGESNVACSDVWPYMQGLNCGMDAAACADYYACQFPAMIEDWRSLFSSAWTGTGSELTFLFVGLPSYVQDLPSTLYDGKNDSSLPLLRLAQRTSTGQDHTFQTSLIDHGYLYGHMGSIHPMDKTPVGKRLMLAAREHAYGEPVISSGPEPNEAKLTGSTLSVSFDPTTVGAAGLLLRTSGAVRQVCMVGHKQLSGNPANDTVPPSQCGCTTGFDVGSAAGGYVCIAEMSIGADKRSLDLVMPAGVAAAGGTSHADLACTLRCLHAEWLLTPCVVFGSRRVHAALSVCGLADAYGLQLAELPWGERGAADAAVRDGCRGVNCDCKKAVSMQTGTLVKLKPECRQCRAAQGGAGRLH